MLARGFNLARLAQRGWGSQSIRRTSYEVKDFKLGTMDDLPLPSGSWQEAYNKTQARYNMYLVASSIFFVISVAVGIQTDTLNLYTGPAFKNK